MANARFCSQCGEPLEGRFKFCPCCASPVEAFPDQTRAAAKPAAQPATADKITPISPEARRVLEQFDAQFAELKSKRNKQQSTLSSSIKNALGPKAQIIVIASSAVSFIVFLIFMFWLFSILMNYLKHIPKY
ncbi:MAG: hypothetical protein WCX65_00305 [bacterium]